MTILDGAMGTILQSQGLKLGDLPEELNITAPDSVISVHKAYINAGADIIYANTFGANPRKAQNSRYGFEEIIQSGVLNAKKACAGTNAKTALDVGSIGQMVEPLGTLKFEEAYNIYKEIILKGSPNADFIFFETFSDLFELKAAVLAALENSALPVFCTMTFEENHRTFTGTSVREMAYTLQNLGVSALGINCSLGPKEMFPMVNELSKISNLPIIVKPNAGLPDQKTGEFKLSPEDFAKDLADILKLPNVEYAGGCCGTTPAHIKALCEIITHIDRDNITSATSAKRACVCSGTKTVCIDSPRIVGERLNPTGKKRFQEALKNSNIDYILSQALEQQEAGAEILDVNVGVPGTDEISMMKTIVKALQSVTDLPLQIDSSNPDVIEAGLRIYNGKAIINSTSCEREKLEKIVPIAKKYGAALIVLLTDENGIPPTWQSRVETAKKAIDFIEANGIAKEDIIVDCLTLTASAEQAKVAETLRAVSEIKKLGYKTVLGVSNVSFGLPDRETVNSVFLSAALTNGLDLAIINPNIRAMTDTVRAYRVLANIDENAEDFIKTRSSAPPPENYRQAEPSDGSDEKNLKYCVSKGLSAQAAKITADMLKTTEALKIVDEELIPALDKVGLDFENGKLYLPQLILSASAAGAAFEVIASHYAKSGVILESKGVIVVATVKGDIHDIGKNIAKVILENYGYTVIDLGRDVAAQTILESAKSHGAKLIGLSALMTTTLKSMEETIALLRKSHNCKIMVGGAVVTEEYALSIGADYYAKDAKRGVDIAKTVFSI